MLTIKVTPANQGSKPSGWLGRFNLWRMNSTHSKLTDWGLRHISIDTRDNILDVGCGGGRTVAKLAEIAKQGKIYGIDHSEESITASKKYVAQYISLGRVEILHGSVSQLPFPITRSISSLPSKHTSGGRTYPVTRAKSSES